MDTNNESKKDELYCVQQKQISNINSNAEFMSDTTQQVKVNGIFPRNNSLFNETTDTNYGLLQTNQSSQSLLANRISNPQMFSSNNQNQTITSNQKIMSIFNISNNSNTSIFQNDSFPKSKNQISSPYTISSYQNYENKANNSFLESVQENNSTLTGPMQILFGSKNIQSDFSFLGNQNPLECLNNQNLIDKSNLKNNGLEKLITQNVTQNSAVNANSSTLTKSFHNNDFDKEFIDNIHNQIENNPSLSTKLQENSNNSVFHSLIYGNNLSLNQNHESTVCSNLNNNSTLNNNTSEKELAYISNDFLSQRVKQSKNLQQLAQSGEVEKQQTSIPSEYQLNNQKNFSLNQDINRNNLKDSSSNLNVKQNNSAEVTQNYDSDMENLDNDRNNITNDFSRIQLNDRLIAFSPDRMSKAQINICKQEYNLYSINDPKKIDNNNNNLLQCNNINNFQNQQVNSLDQIIKITQMSNNNKRNFDTDVVLSKNSNNEASGYLYTLNNGNKFNPNFSSSIPLQYNVNTSPIVDQSYYPCQNTSSTLQLKTSYMKKKINFDGIIKNPKIKDKLIQSEIKGIRKDKIIMKPNERLKNDRKPPSQYQIDNMIMKNTNTARRKAFLDSVNYFCYLTQNATLKQKLDSVINKITSEMAVPTGDKQTDKINNMIMNQSTGLMSSCGSSFQSPNALNSNSTISFTDSKIVSTSNTTKLIETSSFCNESNQSNSASNKQLQNDEFLKKVSTSNQFLGDGISIPYITKIEEIELKDQNNFGNNILSNDSEITNNENIDDSSDNSLENSNVNSSTQQSHKKTCKAFRSSGGPGLIKSFFCCCRECCSMVIESHCRSPYCSKGCQIREQNLRQKRVRTTEAAVLQKAELLSKMLEFETNDFDRTNVINFIANFLNAVVSGPNCENIGVNYLPNNNNNNNGNNNDNQNNNILPMANNNNNNNSNNSNNNNNNNSIAHPVINNLGNSALLIGSYQTKQPQFSNNLANNKVPDWNNFGNVEISTIVTNSGNNINNGTNNVNNNNNVINNIGNINNNLNSNNTNNNINNSNNNLINTNIDTYAQIRPQSSLVLNSFTNNNGNNCSSYAGFGLNNNFPLKQTINVNNNNNNNGNFCQSFTNGPQFNSNKSKNDSIDQSSISIIFPSIQ